MLPKRLRLSAAEVKEVLARGKSMRVGTYTAKYLAGRSPLGVAVIVSKKVARKAPAKKAAKKATTAKPTSAARPGNDAIARAAYLNYRRRVEQGLPGDTRGDWLEAERQLGIVGQA